MIPISDNMDDISMGDYMQLHLDVGVNTQSYAHTNHSAGGHGHL